MVTCTDSVGIVLLIRPEMEFTPLGGLLLNEDKLVIIVNFVFDQEKKRESNLPSTLLPDDQKYSSCPQIYSQNELK